MYIICMTYWNKENHYFRLVRYPSFGGEFPVYYQLNKIKEKYIVRNVCPLCQLPRSCDILIKKVFLLHIFIVKHVSKF